MLDRIRRGPSAALVVAFIALFVALSGGAYAVKKIGTKGLKNGAVTGKKIKNGAVTTGKLRDGSVITTKLAPGERSEAFVTKPTGTAPLPIATDTAVATLSLPPGAFVVTAGTNLGGGAAIENVISCDLRDDGTASARGAGEVDTAAFEETITLTAVSDGGTLVLTCNPTAAAVARDRTITAIRVGFVQAQ